MDDKNYNLVIDRIDNCTTYGLFTQGFRKCVLSTTKKHKIRMYMTLNGIFTDGSVGRRRRRIEKKRYYGMDGSVRLTYVINLRQV